MSVEQQGDTMTFERGVFTSIRSPMGVGYKLVAATSGITREERQEITRAAPSHDSLSTDIEGATGLLSFTLSTGRTCVMLSRNAGAEQTGRGGQRIHTEVVVLEPEQIARFQWNPLRVEQSVRAVLGSECLIPKDRIDLLTCSLLEPEPLEPPSPEEREQLARVLAYIMSGTPLVLSACGNPEAIFALLLQVVPAVSLRGRALCFGIKYAPSRRCDLLLPEPDGAETRKLEQKYQLDVHPWGGLPETESSAWCDLVRGRTDYERIARLAAELNDDDNPDLLRRCAAMLRQLPLVPLYTLSKLNELGDLAADAGVPASLRADWKLAIERRRDKIEAEAPKPTED